MPVRPKFPGEAESSVLRASAGFPPQSRQDSGFVGETFGRYQVIKRIGRGGMAEVFHARFAPAPGVTKEVVLKRILPAYSEQPEFRKMFLAEAKLCMRLSHGNVVQVFDAGEVDESLFLAMEFVDGVALDQVMERATQKGFIGLPPVVAALIMIEVLKGLHHAHTRTGDDGRPLNLVHRDISPDNVLVSYEGEVKVTDFGIAKAAMAGRELTRPGIFKGKFTYGAPEQARGEAVDARADVYACGIVLYELIAGANPTTNTEVAKEVGSGARALPRFPVHLADPEFVNIITRALSPHPGDRYSTAQQFQQALLQWAAVRAGAHMASGIQTTMRWLFGPELMKRNPQGFEPAPENFFVSLGARLPLGVVPESTTRGRLERVADPVTRDGLPAFAVEALEKSDARLKPGADEADGGMTIRHVTAIGLVGSALLVMLGVFLWTQESGDHSDSRTELEDAAKRKVLPPTAPPLAGPVLPVAPADAGAWEAPPPPVFRVDKVPAEFRLTDSHLLFVDAAVFLETSATTRLTVKRWPRVKNFNVGPVFAFQRNGDEGIFTRLELGRPAPLSKQLAGVQLFTVATVGSVNDLYRPASIDRDGKVVDLVKSSTQFVGPDRRVSVEGLDPRKSYLLTLAPAKPGGKTDGVLVLVQGENKGRPASLDGAPGTALLPVGEHLVSNTRAMQLVVPTANGLARDDLKVTLALTEDAPQPGPAAKPKKPAVAAKVTTTVAEAKPHFDKANDAMAAGLTADARAALSKGLRADPRNANGHYWAGVLAQRQSDVSGALFSFQLFLKTAPDDHPNRAEVEKLIATLEKNR